MGLEGIVSKRALSPYKSRPSKFWLKTKNVVESEMILLGTEVRALHMAATPIYGLRQPSMARAKK
jgi:ATP-dependent DNA ligase